MSSKFLAEFRQFFKPFSSWVCDSTFNFCILEKFYSMPLLIIYPPSDWKVIAWASVCECAFSCVSNICTNSPGGKTCFIGTNWISCGCGTISAHIIMLTCWSYGPTRGYVPINVGARKCDRQPICDTNLWRRICFCKIPNIRLLADFHF